MFEEKLLVWNLRRGNKDALRKVYEKYRDDLLRLAASLLSDSSTAEDVVHDVFLSFARKARQFSLTGSLKGYLATCVANRARDMGRSARRRSSISQKHVIPTEISSSRPDRWLVCSEEFQQLNDALSKLPYEQKEALILHVQGELKFQEIAGLQGVSVRTAQSRYRYGMSRLRSLLDSEVEL